MDDYQKRFATTLAKTGALFFDDGLVLKDGRPTPYFVNMAMFRTGRLSMELGSFFAGMMASRGLSGKTDVILGPSYKGSAIALATAIALWQEYQLDILFEYDRKEAKTHGEGSVWQSLFVNRAFFEGCRIFIVDDVATSMGTKFELLEKVQAEADAGGQSFHVVGIGIGMDREQTTAVYDRQGRIILDEKGNHAVQDFVSKSGIPVFSVAGIREIVAYLHETKVPVLIRGERKPMDSLTRTTFDQYLERYGTDASLRTIGGHE